MTASQPKRVLICHQSTIPHYRVRFYELLEQMRPQDWEFRVAFDTRESLNPSIYIEPVDWRGFRFPILDVRTRTFRIGGRKLLWQSFFRAAGTFDLLVTDTHLANLTYPAIWLHRLHGVRIALWGHTHDMNIVARGVKRVTETLKRAWVRRANGFFAYTPSGRDELLRLGFPVDRIFVLNNTVDTVAEREAFKLSSPRREEFREQLGVGGKRVLLYVGRMLPGKRIDFLLQAFREAFRGDPSLHLFTVGGGPEEALVSKAQDELGAGAITCFGPIAEREMLAPIFVASDVFVLPGYVGLSPLQAACYDLPTVAFDLDTHSPEFSYLSPENSVILPRDTNSSEFAREIPKVLERFETVGSRDTIYKSISHLSIESMVRNFIDGIETIFNLR